MRPEESQVIQVMLWKGFDFGLFFEKRSNLGILVSGEGFFHNLDSKLEKRLMPLAHPQYPASPCALLKFLEQLYYHRFVPSFRRCNWQRILVFRS